MSQSPVHDLEPSLYFAVEVWAISLGCQGASQYRSLNLKFYMSQLKPSYRISSISFPRLFTCDSGSTLLCRLVI